MSEMPAKKIEKVYFSRKDQTPNENVKVVLKMESSNFHSLGDE